jgi:hypothetical protein
MAGAGNRLHRAGKPPLPEHPRDALEFLGRTLAGQSAAVDVGECGADPAEKPASDRGILDLAYFLPEHE